MIVVSAVLCSVAPMVGQHLITTVVGTDHVFPDGGRAIDLPLGRALYGLALDQSGNLYIPDSANLVVFKVAPDDTVHVVAGSGLLGSSGDGATATAASFRSPSAVALDGAGNLYVADQGNCRIRKVTSAGAISAFAGTGTCGFSGDGGIATRATFSAIIGCVAFDPNGNLVVCDTFNSRIRSITPAGIVSTIAGNGQLGYSGDGGPATAASLGYPRAIRYDSSGQLYLVDNYYNVVRRVSADGIITTIAGNGNAGFGGDGGPAVQATFNNPFGIAFDPNGNLYVTDNYNNRVRMISGQGIVTTVAGNGSASDTGDGGPALLAGFARPYDIVWDEANGRLLVSDLLTGRIRGFTPGRSVTTVAGNGLFADVKAGTTATQAFLGGPYGLVLDAAGNLYIADHDLEAIWKVTSDGLFQNVLGTPGVNLLGQPYGITIASDGALIIVDQAGANYVRRLIPGGSISIIAGTGPPGYSGDGGPATQAMLNSPANAAYDAAGNLYITDTRNHRVRRVSTDGIIRTFAGNGVPAVVGAPAPGDGGPATAASLASPSGIAIDGSGNVYIGEQNPNRIRKVTADGRISTFAGTGVSGNSGDGGPATSASLGPVNAVTFDLQGNLYLISGAVLRRITPAGIISTVAGTGQLGFSGDGGPASAALLGMLTGVAAAPDGTLYVSDPMNHRVRAILATGPTYVASASQLSFTVTSGGSTSEQQNLALGASLRGQQFNGLPFVISTSSASAGWLQLTTTTGTMPAAIGVSVDPSKLNPGTYQGVIQINAAGAAQPQTLINVTANVAAANPPRISVDQPQLVFSVQTGSGSTFRVLTVSNSGSSSLNVTATASSSGGNWLSLSPVSGNATPNSSLPLVVSVIPGSLASGTYSGKIVIASDSQQVSVPVTLAVSMAQTNLVLSQTGLTFTAVAQGGMVPPQTFGILNTGAGSMTWAASSSTLSGGSNWLRVSPTSGTVTQPYLDVSIVTVSINPAGLAPGDYYGRVDLNADGAPNSPQTVTIVLNVLPPGSRPGPVVSPTGLIFTGFANSTNPGAQTVSISNLTSTPVTFGSSQTYVVPGNWLLNVPSNATVSPTVPVQMTVQPDFSGLPAGVSRAFVTLGFSDGSSRIVNVLSVVAPAGAGTSGKNEERYAVTCSPSVLQVLPTNLQSTFTARVDQPVSVEAKVVDDCGTAVTPNRGGTAVTMRFSNGDNALSMVHTGGGRWAGSWQPRNTITSDVRIAITAILLTADGRSSFGGQTFLNCTLSTGAAVPRVDTGRILNGASFSAQGPVAPGTLITVFGSNLAGVQASSDNPLVTKLGDTQVVLGGRPVPLKYASEGQLNAQIPYDIAINTQLQLLVQRGTALSVGEAITVAAAQPAIFTVSQQGTGQGVIFHADTSTLADQDAPAHAGETMIIYCAGLGAVNPPVTSGQGAPPDSVLSVVNEVSVTIGGSPAEVSQSTLAPGLPGVYQVRAIVPDEIPASSAAPVTLTVSGQPSPTVTMAVE